MRVFLLLLLCCLFVLEFLAVYGLRNPFRNQPRTRPPVQSPRPPKRLTSPRSAQPPKNKSKILGQCHAFKFKYLPLSAIRGAKPPSHRAITKSCSSYLGKKSRVRTGTDNWIVRLQYWNESYAAEHDEIPPGREEEHLVVCVNMRTDHSLVLTKGGVDVKVKGVARTYKETGRYDGFTYTVLRIKEENYTYVRDACNSLSDCRNNACRAQPGPQESFWRYELEPTAANPRPRIMSGVSDVTIMHKTAQAAARRWSTKCCLDDTVGVKSRKANVGSGGAAGGRTQQKQQRRRAQK